MKTTIDIVRDFARYPAGRYRIDGPASGQRFREELLTPALRKGSTEVVLDEVLGLPSSFLEEAFGGLIRDDGFSYDEVSKRLTLVAKTSRMASYPAEALDYLRDAEKVRLKDSAT